VTATRRDRDNGCTLDCAPCAIGLESCSSRARGPEMAGGKLKDTTAEQVIGPS